MSEAHPVRTGNSWGTTGPRLPCVREGCGRFLDVTLPGYLRYFVGDHPQCVKCGQQVDLWEAARASVIDHRIDFITLQLAGALLTPLSLILDPGKRARVELTALGIPADARIIAINYSEGQGFRPIEIPDSYQPPRRQVPRCFDILALPDDKFSARTKDIVATVVWAPADVDFGPYAPLLDAAEHLCSDELGQVAVLSHSAVETGLRGIVAKDVSTTVPTSRGRRFARSLRGAEAREVMLPLIASRLDLPPLPEFHGIHMADLQDARNDLVHGTAAQSRDEAAGCYLTAVFALAYTSLVTAAQEGSLWYDPEGLRET